MATYYAVGLTDAPSAFMRLMSYVLRTFIGNFCLYTLLIFWTVAKT